MMAPSRMVLAGVACAAILAAGYVAAPQALPTIDFVQPVGNAPDPVDGADLDDGR